MKLLVKKVVTLLLVFVMLMSCTAYSFAASAANTYRTNAAGETYGTLAQAETIGYESDLILAVGENDVTGYVKSADLNAENDLSPQEAVELQNQRIAEGYMGTYVPLYDKDGETVIGRFLIAFDEDDIARSDNATAFANNASNRSGPLNSYYVVCPNDTFLIWSEMSKANMGVRGHTFIRVTTSPTAPVGYMGAKARVFRADDNALVRETNWYYNDVPRQEFEVNAYYFTVTNNAYYAQGYTREFNEEIDNYWTHVTNRSANINP